MPWVLNFQGYKGFTCFCKYDRDLNMRRNAIVKEFSIFKDSEYANFCICKHSKKGQGRALFPPSCPPESVTDYTSISLNIPKHPWKCLNKLFWLCQGSEYARSCHMFHRILKIPGVLNVQEFSIWHSCIFKGYAKFLIWLNMTQYASVMPEYALLCFNSPQWLWTWLDIVECCWICLKMSE